MAKKSSSNRKKKYDGYKASKRREKNKVLKLRKYLKTHPNNQVAAKRLKELDAVVTI